MKKQLELILIFTILISIGLSGCDQVGNPSNSETDKFVGGWRSTVPEYSAWLTVFYSNGTVVTSDSATTINGTWDVKDGKITIKMSDDEAPLAYTYSFSENNTTLTLISISSGETSVFTKQ